VAPFQKKVLQLVDAIYGFIGGLLSELTVDTETPVQLVHDVSRGAERASGQGGFGGYLIRTLEVTHAGSDTQRATLIILTSLADTNFDPAVHDLWFINASRSGDTSGVNQRGADSVTFPIALPDIDVATIRLLAIWGTEKEEVVSGTFNILPGLNLGGLPVVDQLNQQPMLITKATTIDMKSTALAVAGDIFATYLLWYGAKGSTPPGMP